MSYWRSQAFTRFISLHVLISLKWYEIETSLQWTTDRKSYPCCRLVPLPMILNDLYLRSFQLVKPGSRQYNVYYCIIIGLSHVSPVKLRCLYRNRLIFDRASVARVFSNSCAWFLVICAMLCISAVFCCRKVSGTTRYCVQTAELIVRIHSPPDSLNILVFPRLIVNP